MNSLGGDFAEFVSKLRAEVDTRPTRLRKRESSRNVLAQNLRELDEQIRQLQGKPVRNNDHRSERRNELAHLEEAMTRRVDKIDELMRCRIARVPLMGPASNLSCRDSVTNLDAERRVEHPRQSAKFLENLERARDLATAIEQRQTSPRLIQPKRKQPMPQGSRLTSDHASRTESDARQIYRVTLTVVGAANLPDLSQDKWLGGCCDPYVKLQLGCETIETCVCPNTRNPTWSYSRTLERVTGELELEIEVWDKRKGLVADILLGQCEKLNVRLNAFCQDEPSELRIPVQIGDGAPHECYVTIELWAERWMVLQFCPTSIESLEGHAIDEDSFLKLQLRHHPDPETVCTRAPDRGRLAPLEVVSFELPMIQSQTWAEVRLSLIRKERRFIGDPVEHEAALFGNIKARLGAPSYLTVHWDKQHQYKLEYCVRLRCSTSNFLVPPIPATITARSDYVRWAVKVGLPQRSERCPSHGDTEAFAELRLPPFTQETATASCAIPGCMRFDAISRQNECEMVLILRESSSTAGLAFSHFVAREEGPVILSLNSLCPSCSWSMIEVNCELTPWIYIYLGTLEGRIDCVLGKDQFQLTADRSVIIPIFETATDMRFPQHRREYHLRNYLTQESLHPSSVGLDLDGATVRLSWSLMPIDELTNLVRTWTEPARHSDGRRYRNVLRVISITGLAEKACLVRLNACTGDIARATFLLPSRDADELVKMSCSDPHYTKRVESDNNAVFNSDVAVDAYLDSIIVFAVMDSGGSAVSIGALDPRVLEENEEFPISLEPSGELKVLLTSKPERWPFVCLHQIGESPGEIAWIRCTPGHEARLPLRQAMVLGEVNPDTQLVVALLNADKVEISTAVVRHFESRHMITFEQGLCLRMVISDGIEDLTRSSVSWKSEMWNDPSRPGIEDMRDTPQLIPETPDSVAGGFDFIVGHSKVKGSLSVIEQDVLATSRSELPLTGAATVSNSGNSLKSHPRHGSSLTPLEEVRSITVEVRHFAQGGLSVEPSIFLCYKSPLRIIKGARGSTAEFGLAGREHSIFITGSRADSYVGWHEIDLSTAGKGSAWVAFRPLDSDGLSTDACGEYRLTSKKYPVL
ncbi:hypothetical protein FOL47_011280 [Perkinsus chesapeaki]|uniref:C2 domain-containing protein n=1 Tax=Perkinsus chesapeaki TaxID=330153 RepID=A0A7J6MPG7_PERCH|nr:hypothetical protein FOL47_011280 [Perkinsus chesapeaki]